MNENTYPSTEQLARKKVRFQNVVPEIKRCSVQSPPCFVKIRSMNIRHLNFDLGRKDPKLIVEEKNVTLEKLSLENIYLVGTILVNNNGYKKQVFIRYSIDNWQTYQEIPCTFLNCATKKIDRFRFRYDLLTQMAKILEEERCSSILFSFAICYKVNDTILWDNNNELNYNIQTEHVIDKGFRNKHKNNTHPILLKRSQSEKYMDLPSQAPPPPLNKCASHLGMSLVTPIFVGDP
eukprot:TRINITY_DN12496_c0_g1_i1.p1 TRINITY_DN12496_c0_g1~~TRINITY_DN12496_c0_g1_i1.p1  ORF type:complete len:235 (-),score=31.69 TRINITY_DN12496_c0_g1_i1:220-924(-)